MKALRFKIITLFFFAAVGAIAEDAYITVCFSKRISPHETLEVICESTPLPLRTDKQAAFNNSNIDLKTGLPTNVIPVVFTNALERSNWVAEGRRKYLIMQELHDRDLKPVNPDYCQYPEIRNRYIPVLMRNGQAVINRNYSFDAGLKRTEKYAVIDVMFEPGAAVYLCRLGGEEFADGNNGSLILTRVLSTTNTFEYVRRERWLWNRLDGDFSEVKSARLVGSHQQGTLSVEVDSVRGNHTIITNRLVNGRWVVTESAPIVADGKK